MASNESFPEHLQVTNITVQTLFLLSSSVHSLKDKTTPKRRHTAGCKLARQQRMAGLRSTRESRERAGRKAHTDTLARESERADKGILCHVWLPGQWSGLGGDNEGSATAKKVRYVLEMAKTSTHNTDALGPTVSIHAGSNQSKASC